MNSYSDILPRKRHRHLLIVEGNHEKNELMELLLKCFPEIDMNMDDIVIYGTNIYMLYQNLDEMPNQTAITINTDNYLFKN